MPNFRDHQPTRTYTGSFSTYTKYKPFLAADFSNRCGYTNCSDSWFGGRNNFHIDHFIPWKNYPARPELKNDYSNLIYSCSYVNILKSNDEGNYIDPCIIDFNLHFTRDNVGRISPVPTSPQGVYMFKKLKLYMKRYQVIWLLDNLRDKVTNLSIVIKTLPPGQQRQDLLEMHFELSDMFMKYLKYLQHQQ